MEVKKGLFFMALGAFSFGVMNALIKITSQHYSPLENVFYRALFMIIFMGLLYFTKPFKFGAHKQGGGKILAWRMVLGAVAMVLLCYNIYTMPLGTAIAFGQSAPIYAIFIAWLVFKEPLTWRLAIAGVLGLLGVMLIANPHTSGLTFGLIVCGVLSALFKAIAYTSLSQLKAYYDSGFVIFVFALFLCAIGALGLFLNVPPFATGHHPLRFSGAWWQWDIWLLMGMSFFGTLGQYFLTRAYMCAPAGLVSPIDYTRLLWATLFGVWLGDPWLGFYEGLGMALVVGSGLLIIFNKKK
ncbi:Membrane transport protein [Helicobacter sp. NHP19-003]|uniref:Membrane transport protein n=1 Tax=Helicobacter gastrocanis TaxID=2849641 RepID=A0ABM7S9B8_9HELI|nr:DMT family transporter [Helicobacter sp. NHP19-003]BCZ17134.1 Membrane transport protein [Helicobacter sp. NHP19-003]